MKNSIFSRSLLALALIASVGMTSLSAMQQTKQDGGHKSFNNPNLANKKGFRAKVRELAGRSAKFVSRSAKKAYHFVVDGPTKMVKTIYNDAATYNKARWEYMKAHPAEACGVLARNFAFYMLLRKINNDVRITQIMNNNYNCSPNRFPPAGKLKSCKYKISQEEAQYITNSALQQMPAKIFNIKEIYMDGNIQTKSHVPLEVVLQDNIIKGASVPEATGIAVKEMFFELLRDFSPTGDFNFDFDVWKDKLSIYDQINLFIHKLNPLNARKK
jgi:hypothetical protein